METYQQIEKSYKTHFCIEGAVIFNPIFNF